MLAKRHKYNACIVFEKNLFFSKKMGDFFEEILTEIYYQNNVLMFTEIKVFATMYSNFEFFVLFLS